MTYPKDWPRCHCGEPVLDGHVTCGRVECDEHGTRRARDVLSIWTIYDHPRDFPEGFVAREWTAKPGEESVPSDYALTAPDIDILRERMLEMGLVCLTRMPDDDPAIVETWV